MPEKKQSKEDKKAKEAKELDEYGKKFLESHGLRDSELYSFIFDTPRPKKKKEQHKDSGKNYADGGAVGMMGLEEYPEGMPMAPDEVGVEQGTAEDERASLELAMEQFPIVGTIIEKLMAAAAPPAESPEDTVKANLAPGEFVFTADAVKSIGVDKLQGMMNKAEESFAQSQGGQPVEGEEMAFSKGGYVNEQGQRGFVEQMYEEGKEAQAKYHRDSGNNYADGDLVEEEQYMRGKPGGSILDRLTEGFMGGGEEAPAPMEISPQEEYKMRIEAMPQMQEVKERAIQYPESREAQENVDWTRQMLMDQHPYK